MRTDFRISRQDRKGKSKHSLRAFLTFTFLLLAFFVAQPSLRSQTQPAQAAKDQLELYQALLDLTNPWTVMCVAAHPDDEDGATLTVLRRKYGAHTVTLFSTFGEGGQNAIGPELYEELGAIRARETLQAAEIQGSEAHFLALRDFGFSKSADEAFRIWGHEEALRRMVFRIRTLRPDVIITNHDTTSGHGHHQATGRLVLEAFDAAADPKRFPEQLEQAGAMLWQPQRLFVRASYANNDDGKALEAEDKRAGRIIVINPNERDAVRGSTYAEQALQALQKHASQGPWPSAVPAGGRPPIRYRLARKAQDAPPLPANAQTFLDDLQLSKTLNGHLSWLKLDGRRLLDFSNERSRILDALIAANERGAFASKASKKDLSYFQLMRERLYAALAQASGIRLTVTPRVEAFLPSAPALFSATVSNRGEREVRLNINDSGINEFIRISPEVKEPLLLAPQTTHAFTVDRLRNRPSPITVPSAGHLYDGLWRGEKYVTQIDIEVGGTSFPLAARTWVDIAPAMQIARISPSPYVLTPATLNKHLTFKLGLVNYLNTPFKGNLVIDNDADSIHEVANPVVLSPHEKREMEFKSNVIPVDGPDERRNPKALPHTLKLSISAPDSTERITEQKVSIVYSDARVAPSLRVGYVRSFDDTLRNALDALGVESKELTIEDVRAGELQKFDTIIIDNRGYQAHPELVAANSRLLEFANNGGTLIVFYHKSNEWNPDPQKNRPQLAPLPITLGNERVTDEDAPVAFTDAQHPLLNVPNKITHDDFKGWVQERGLYYPKTWDAQYRALLSMSDTGEASLKGGLLTLDYGRGHYIYTSMVWYRQLLAGIPGAYRMFANMISYRNAKATGR